MLDVRVAHGVQWAWATSMAPFIRSGELEVAWSFCSLAAGDTFFRSRRKLTANRAPSGHRAVSVAWA
jgi:hypothetical protein